MNNSLILQILSESIRANQQALDLSGRSLSLMFGTCTNVSDPLGMRRIKVALESKAGLVESDWALRLPVNPYHDAPLPLPGTSVLVAAIDGDIHDLCWISVCCNDTNPADEEQEDFINDSTIRIPGNNKETIGGNDMQVVEGDRTTTVKGDRTHTTEQDERSSVLGNYAHTVNQQETRRTDQNLVVSCGQSITFKTDSGASLTLAASGAVILADAFGHRWNLGGGSGSDWVWDLNGATVQIVNAGGVTINDRQIAVVGARDSDNDTLVNRGY